jgi:ABC-type nitrate/sulfonate/bicarbonate transport system substrate-binding protein
LPQNALIVTDKKIQQSRDQVKRVIKGTIEALRFIQENKSESIDILASYSRSDKPTAIGMFESYFPAYSPNGAMSDAALAAALEDAVTRAKLDKKIALTQIADRSIYAEAQKEMAAEKR